MKIKIKNFGHPAHFICGNNCRFHLATQVGDYLISTVGELVFDSSVKKVLDKVRDDREFEEIGFGRTYETMVFRAGEKCEAEGCNCGLPVIDGSELDFLGYNDADSANKGHQRLVAKWLRKQVNQSKVIR